MENDELAIIEFEDFSYVVGRRESYQQNRNRHDSQNSVVSQDPYVEEQPA